MESNKLNYISTKYNHADVIKKQKTKFKSKKYKCKYITFTYVAYI